MKPCQIKTKEAVVKRLNNPELKQYFLDNDANLNVEVRTNGVTVTSTPLNNSTIDNATKLLTNLKTKVTSIFGNIVEDIKVDNNKASTNIRFNDKTFSIIDSSVNAVEIKPGVQELFNENPELSVIGTQEQYSNYLNTIFPDSEVKDIVYHGSDKKFENFKLDTVNRASNTASIEKGIYLADTLQIANEYSTIDGSLKAVVINSKKYTTLNGNQNPDLYSKDYLKKLDASLTRKTMSTILSIYANSTNSEEIEKNLKQLTDSNDTIIFNNINDFPQTNIDRKTILNNLESAIGQKTIWVKSPEQIHILGSNKDIERFSNFVNNTTQEEFTKEVVLDDPLDKKMENIFYNLNDKDVLRRKSNPKLNRLLRRIVQEMGVDVQKMEEYKKYWESRPENKGKVLTQLGLADITRKLLVFSETDGVTLPEEAFHFIVFANWNTPEIQAIVNHPSFTSTDVYKLNTEKYRNAYGETITDEVLLDEKINMEILGKMLAEYMYDINSNNTGTIGSFLKGLIKKFLDLFRAKTSQNAKLDRNKFEESLREALDIVVEDLTLNAEQSKFAVKVNGTSEVLIKKDTYFKDVLEVTVKDLQVKLEEVIQRQVGLTTAQVATYNAYVAKHKMSKPSEIEVHINKLNAKVAKGLKLSATEQLLLDDLNKFIKYALRNELGEENTLREKRLQARKEQLEDDIKAAKYEAGLYMFIMGTQGNGGVNRELEEMLKFRDKVLKEYKETGKVISLEQYARLAQTLHTYLPIINLISSSYIQGNKLNLDKDPVTNKKMNAELQKAIADLDRRTDIIKKFLQSQSEYAKASKMIEYQTINPDIDLNKKHFSESNQWNVWLGSLQHNKEEFARIFENEVNTINHAISEKNNNFAVDLWEQVKSIMPTIKPADFKEFINGKPSAYYLSEVYTQKWVDNEKQAMLNAVKAANDAGLALYGRKFNVPTDFKEQQDFFRGTQLFLLEEKHLNKELERRAELKKVYNRYMASWYTANTQDKPNAQQIIDTKKATMTAQQFSRWYNKQVMEVEVGLNGEMEYRYRGELVMPSTGITKEESYISKSGNTITKKIDTEDYTNPAYMELRFSNPEKFRALQYLKDLNNQDKQRLRLPSYNWETEQRLPQISKNTLDALYTKGIFNKMRLIGTEIKESVVSKIDDDYHGDIIDGKLVKRVPIRYMGKLEPELITDDLIRSIVMFHDMTNRNVEFNNKLPELQGMLDVINYGKVGSDTAISGDGTSTSTLAKVLENFFNANVYGEKGFVGSQVPFGDKKLDVNKISNALMTWMRNTNLMGNVPSILTGYVTGKITSLEESFLKRFYTFNDTVKSEKEFYFSMAEIIKDFESPIKKNKFSIVGAALGIVDDYQSNFSNLDKSRATRMFTQTMNYGGHRMVDVKMKYVIMANVSRGIKYINGEWYTKYKFDKSNLDPKEWDNAETLWDMLDTKDGKIEYDARITPEIKDTWRKRVDEVAHRIDTQGNVLDKAEAHRHFIWRFATMHMQWFFQMMDRGFKTKGFNYRTESIEEGYWNTGWRLIGYNPLNLINAYKDFHTYDQYEQENLKTLLYMTLTSAAMFGLSYILQAIALGDDDEEDPMFRYMVYITTRTFVELSSRVSLGEAWEYAQRPTASLENATNITAPIDLLMSYINVSEEIEKGFYAGYTKEEKMTIKNIPLLKGLFESLYGGYINEALDKPATSVAVNLKAKQDFLANKTNNVPWALSYPTAFIAKLIGYTIARPTAGVITDNPKSPGPLSLPNKKSQK